MIKSSFARAGDRLKLRELLQKLNGEEVLAGVVVGQGLKVGRVG